MGRVSLDDSNDGGGDSLVNSWHGHGIPPCVDALAPWEWDEGDCSVKGGWCTVR